MSTRNRVAIGLVIVAVIGVAGWFVAGPKVVQRVVNATVVPGMNIAGLGLGTYPTIDESNLTSVQRDIVRLTRAEHAEQPEYTKYSEGVREPWCADFVSWIMKEAGVPYSNPNSGHWRIPGTLTLRSYYEQAGRFKAIDSGYVPKVGDVVLYDGAGWFGQHTNIVLGYKDGTITTVGGNEVGKIRVQTKDVGTRGAVGYGVLSNGGDS